MTASIFLVARATPATEANIDARPIRSLHASAIDAPGPAATASGPRTHDGFYLRMSMGGGLVGLDLNPELDFADHSADGATFSLDLLAGASPVRGGAVGGALMLDVAPSVPRAAGAQEERNSMLAIGLLGPFVDIFPAPELGWHMGGTLGLAGVSIRAVDSQRHLLLGIGGAIWGGNEFWIGDEWAMGGALRVTRTMTGGEVGEVELDASSLSASLMLTAVHH